MTEIFHAGRQTLKYLPLAVICLSAFASAQDTVLSPVADFPDSLFTVDTVALNGNVHTKDFVILREMSLRPGSPITREMLEYDKNRIYSLGLFNQVQIAVFPSTPGKAVLSVIVDERWFIFPYPIFGIKDRDWDKLYYGAGLVHTNFRGRNEKLFSNFVFGYDPSVSLAYRNPFLSSEGTFFIEGRTAYSKVRNRSLQAQAGLPNFDERHVSGSLAIGRRFGINHTAWMSAGFEVVDVSDFQPGRTLSPDGKDAYPVASLGYVFDTRDLAEYPSLGSLFRFSTTKFGAPGARLDLVRYSADLRQYTPLSGCMSWTVRTFTDLVAAGPTPTYNRDYFGYGERIRGHFTEVIEGESILGASTELHLTLLAPQYFKVDFLPPEFSTWKFAIVAAAFADAGTAWFRGAPVALNNFSKGYGIGLDFLLPYSAVLRVEYALNEVRRGEFILDAGASF